MGAFTLDMEGNNVKHWKTALIFLGGPAAGALGSYILTAYPAVHAAFCMAS